MENLTETLEVDISEALAEIGRLSDALNASLDAFRRDAFAAIDAMVERVTTAIGAAFSEEG